MIDWQILKAALPEIIVCGFFIVIVVGMCVLEIKGYIKGPK